MNKLTNQEIMEIAEKPFLLGLLLISLIDENQKLREAIVFLALLESEDTIERINEFLK